MWISGLLAGLVVWGLQWLMAPFTVSSEGLVFLLCGSSSLALWPDCVCVWGGGGGPADQIAVRGLWRDLLLLCRHGSIGIM